MKRRRAKRDGVRYVNVSATVPEWVKVWMKEYGERQGLTMSVVVTRLLSAGIGSFTAAGARPQ